MHQGAALRFAGFCNTHVRASPAKKASAAAFAAEALYIGMWGVTSSA